jgi:hypothetical protein
MCHGNGQRLLHAVHPLRVVADFAVFHEQNERFGVLYPFGYKIFVDGKDVLFEFGNDARVSWYPDR